VSCRRYPSHGPSSGRRRHLTRLGSECEFVVLRTYLVAGGFTRPTGDLGLQLCRRIDHVETRSPPYVPSRDSIVADELPIQPRCGPLSLSSSRSAHSCSPCRPAPSSAAAP